MTREYRISLKLSSQHDILSVETEPRLDSLSLLMGDLDTDADGIHELREIVNDWMRGDERDTIRADLVYAELSGETVHMHFVYPFSPDEEIISLPAFVDAMNQYFDLVEQVRESKSMIQGERPRAIIVDLDGTLASCEWRRPLVATEGVRKNWAMFFEMLSNDAVVTEIAQIVREAHAAGTRVLLVSGRPENHRETTMAWLSNNAIPYDELLMRPVGDMRSDVIIKREIFETHIRDRFVVTHVWDDRPELQAEWERFGLSTTLVHDPDLDPTIGVAGRTVVDQAVTTSKLQSGSRPNPGHQR